MARRSTCRAPSRRPRGFCRPWLMLPSADSIAAMRANISADLGCDLARISIKATTTERLGFTGREEGIAAEAVVLIVQRHNPAQ